MVTNWEFQTQNTPFDALTQRPAKTRSTASSSGWWKPAPRRHGRRWRRQRSWNL